MEQLPKLDREAYRARMREAFERAMDQVVDAVDAAPKGRVIRESEEPARAALEEFRRVAYETAMQMKIEAAQAAFPPCGQSGDGPADAAQGAAALQRADGQRPHPAAADSLA